MIPYNAKKLCVGNYRSVNSPKPVEVEEDSSGLPLVVKTPGRRTVIAIDECWRIDDEWWRREPISRLYFSIRLVSGHRLVLYRDLINNHWYQQSY